LAAPLSVAMARPKKAAATATRARLKIILMTRLRVCSEFLRSLCQCLCASWRDFAARPVFRGRGEVLGRRF
jgi:hypothetical protein